jgi:hypothetical protein
VALFRHFFHCSDTSRHPFPGVNRFVLQRFCSGGYSAHRHISKCHNRKWGHVMTDEDSNVQKQETTEPRRLPERRISLILCGIAGAALCALMGLVARGQSNPAQSITVAPSVHTPKASAAPTVATGPSGPAGPSGPPGSAGAVAPTFPTDWKCVQQAETSPYACTEWSAK